MVAQFLRLDAANGDVGFFDSRVETALQGALGTVERARAARDSVIRCDAGDVDLEPVAAARLAANIEHLRSWSGLSGVRRIDGMRNDASIVPAQYAAQELEYLYAQVLDEPIPANNAVKAFAADRSVPFGARSFRIRRRQSAGEAVLYRGQGTAGIPRVNTGLIDEEAKVHYLVTAVSANIFEIASGDFAGRAKLTEDLRTARLVMDQTYNRLLWNGADGALLPGIFNHGYLAKYIATVPFTSASTADQIIAELNTIVNYPVLASKGTYRPNKVAMGQGLYNFLINTRVGSASDKSIMTYWLANNSLGLKEGDIVVCHELDEAGPGGTTGILAYRNDQMGLRHVLVRDFTPLPMQASGFDNLVYCFMALGGIRMEDAGCNILAWLEL